MFVHLLLLRLDISFRVDRIKRPRPAPVPCCLNSPILVDDAVFLLGISGPGDARISFIKGLLLPFGSLPDDVFYLSSSSRPLTMVANTESTLYAPPAGRQSSPTTLKVKTIPKVMTPNKQPSTVKILYPPIVCVPAPNSGKLQSSMAANTYNKIMCTFGNFL